MPCGVCYIICHMQWYFFSVYLLSVVIIAVVEQAAALQYSVFIKWKPSTIILKKALCFVCVRIFFRESERV